MSVNLYGSFFLSLSLAVGSLYYEILESFTEFLELSVYSFVKTQNCLAIISSKMFMLAVKLLQWVKYLP